MKKNQIKIFSKTFLFFIILFLPLFAAYEQIKIGKIDSRYAKILTKEKLKSILKNVERNLESSVKKNLFDLNSNGKPIYILYVSPSDLEKKYEEKLKTLKQIEKKMEQKKKDITQIRKTIEDFQKKDKVLLLNHTKQIKKEINFSKKKIDKKKKSLNKKIANIESYLRKINIKNQRRELTKEQYKQAQEYQKKETKAIRIKENEIRKEINIYNNLQKKYANQVNAFYQSREKSSAKVYGSHNEKVRVYNTYTRKYNQVSFELESISRKLGKPKIKGLAFGTRKVDIITSYKNGKKIVKKKVKNIMNKIEIYGFKNLKELEVVLAHEILHLVGIPHINVKRALMNPFLQKNQLNELKLTRQDIANIKKNF